MKTPAPSLMTEHDVVDLVVIDVQTLLLIATFLGLRCRSPMPGVDSRVRDVMDQIVSDGCLPRRQY